MKASEYDQVYDSVLKKQQNIYSEKFISGLSEKKTNKQIMESFLFNYECKKMILIKLESDQDLILGINHETYLVCDYVNKIDNKLNFESVHLIIIQDLMKRRKKYKEEKRPLN